MFIVLLWAGLLVSPVCLILGVIGFFVLRRKGYRWFAGFSIFLGLVLGVLAFYTYLYFVASSPTAERPSVWAALLGLTVVIAAGTIAWRADTREYLEN